MTLEPAAAANTAALIAAAALTLAMRMFQAVLCEYGLIADASSAHATNVLAPTRLFHSLYYG
jgi:hypothetical protein